MGSPIVSPPVTKPKALSCPNCGAAVEIRGFAHTLSVVCPNCLSVLDATSPELEVLQKFQSKERVKPKVPLGSRGKLGGTEYEVIGFQVRQVSVDSSDFFVWDEYLLFNPYKGFRYLTEYQGHWTVVRVMSSVPEKSVSLRGRPAMTVEGRSYTHFDTLAARTVYVLGEFPWQVHVGDTVHAADYIAPPYMLSSESTSDEVTWSLATYTAGSEIWQAFKVQGSPPEPQGIFANQPSPYKSGVSPWKTWRWLMAALFVVAMLYTFSSTNKQVFSQDYSFAPGGTTQASFVTPEFELGGRDTNVELKIKTDLRDSWAYFNFALINQDTGDAYDFAREVSYYKDSDGSDGSPNNSVRVPGVKSGRYYLRVEPEMDAKGSVMHYSLEIHRDVPSYTFFWIAAVLLLIPPLISRFRIASFEAARWRESDYGPVGG